MQRDPRAWTTKQGMGEGGGGAQELTAEQKNGGASSVLCTWYYGTSYIIRHPCGRLLFQAVSTDDIVVVVVAFMPQRCDT